jgi:hypothetical protein
MDVFNAFVESLKKVFTTKAAEPNNHTYLLAFRTVITMLHSIQSTNTRSETQIDGTGKEDLMALRLLDALSAVLVRHHEVMAVVLGRLRPDSSRKMETELAGDPKSNILQNRS